MRLVITTPLYPPDTGELGGYVKELAKRLCEHHTVRIVAYGSLPEKVEGVGIVTVQKHTPLFWRTVSFFITLWKSSAESDMIYICDGASVGLASILVGTLRNIPCVRLAHNTEIAERLHTQRSPFSTQISIPLTWKLRLVQWLEGVVARRASKLIVPSTQLADTFATLHRIEHARIATVPRVVQTQQHLPFEYTTKSIPSLVLHDDSLTQHQATELISACEELAQENAPIHIYAFGALRPEVIEYIDASAHATYLGHISSAETWVRHTQALATIVIEPHDAYKTVFQSYEASTPVMNFSPTAQKYLSSADTALAAPTFTCKAFVQYTKALLETRDTIAMRTEEHKHYQAHASWKQHLDALERLQSMYDA